MGRVCLKIKKYIYFSSLRARSKIVLGPGLVCFENFQSLIKKRVRVRVRLGLGTHDQRPTTHPPTPIRHSLTVVTTSMLYSTTTKNKTALKE